MAKTSSVGRLARCTIPSTVSSSAPSARSSSGAARRSGRFPAPRSGARRSDARSAARPRPRARLPRSLQAATGSGSSRRQTCAISSQSRSSASVRRELRIDEPRPRQAWARARPSSSSCRSLITSRISLTNGSWSRPARSGSRSSSTPVVLGPAREILAARSLAEREHPVAEPRRDEVEGLLGRVRDTGSLDVRVEVLDVDETSPRADRRCPRSRGPTRTGRGRRPR